MTTSDRQTRKPGRPIVGILALLLFLVATAGDLASAQIYKWNDESGVTHFTNSLDNVPDAARAAAGVFIEKPAMSYADSEAPMSKEDRPPRADSAAGVEDFSELVEAARERQGRDAAWWHGFAAGREEGRAVSLPQPSVLVVERPELVFPPIQTYDPSGLYYGSPYRGTVTVPFDRGRSMGLTRRLQMQERIQAEREWR